MVYNYVLCSEYKCDFLKEADATRQYENKTIQVDIELLTLSKKEKNFTYQYLSNAFKGKWNDVEFDVNFEKFSIRIVAPSVEIAFLILLNIPLSLLLLSDNKIILHCSCTMDEFGIYAFSGNKGDGKSTIAAIFAAHNRAIFSDDTLCIDIDGKTVYSNNTIEKYSQNTVSMLEDLTDVGDLTINEYNHKFIKRLDAYQAVQNLRKLNLVFLFRGDCFHCKKITNNSIKKNLFMNNIVGYKYVNQETKIKINQIVEKLFSSHEISVKILYIPQIDINSIKSFKDNLEIILK